MLKGHLDRENALNPADSCILAQEVHERPIISPFVKRIPVENENFMGTLFLPEGTVIQYQVMRIVQ